MAEGLLLLKARPSRARALPRGGAAKTQPLFLFLVLVVGNGLLAYAPLGLGVKVCIGFAGILLPLLGALSLPGTSPPPGPREAAPSSPLLLWLLMLGAAGAVGVRLYRLVSLPAWPMWDDAYNAYFSLGLLRHWSFQVFFAQEKIPFPFYWIQSLYFRIFPPSLGTLWLFPALFSILALPLGYGACRRYFPKSLSLLFLAILAFSFWPLYLGRFCLVTALNLVWEFLALGLLGLFLKSLEQDSSRLWALALGLWLGLGFYTSILCGPAAALAALAALGGIWLRKGRAQAPLLSGLVLVPMLLLFLPLAPGFLDSLGNGHLHDYLVMNRPVDQAQQAAASLSYWTMFLWGAVHPSYFNFGPLWGGFLNPLLGAAFLLGWVELYRWRPAGRKVWINRPYFWGAVVVFLAYLVPATLSNSVEAVRISPLMPFTLLISVFGIRSLLPAFPLRWRTAALVLFFLLSFCLDAFHLLGPYHQWAIPGPQSLDSKSPERYRAFQVLDQVQAKEGPGIVLTEFVTDIFDQSLLIAAYPFNAARNPALDPAKARWAAVLADSSFRSYFALLFPRSQTYSLAGGLPGLEGNLALFLFPLEGPTKPVVQKWLAAHQTVQDLFGLVPYHAAHPDLGPALEKLESCRDSFTGDPFLESCYWDKMAGLQALNPGRKDEAMESLRKEVLVLKGGPALRCREAEVWQNLAEDEQDFHHDGAQAILDLNHALQTGCPSPGVYHQLAQLEIDRKDYRRALWAVGQAWKLQPQNPPPAGLVQWLKDQLGAKEKGGVK